MHALIYEGHMLIYHPHTNISQWVPMRGISASLSSVELRLANNLNNICPYLHYGRELMKLHSPKLVRGIPAGKEMDTDGWNEPSDSEEWDQPERSDWSCCLTLPLGEEGPTWEKVTAEPPKRKIITDEEGATWEEVTGDPLQRKVASNKEDSDWDADTHTQAELQSGDVSMQSLLHKETFMDTLEELPAESPWDNALVEVSVGPGSQDVVQIHAGNDDLD